MFLIILILTNLTCKILNQHTNTEIRFNLLHKVFKLYLEKGVKIPGDGAE